LELIRLAVLHAQPGAGTTRLAGRPAGTSVSLPNIPAGQQQEAEVQ